MGLIVDLPKKVGETTEVHPWNLILGVQVVNVSVPEEKVGEFAKALWAESVPNFNPKSAAQDLISLHHGVDVLQYITACK